MKPAMRGVQPSIISRATRSALDARLAIGLVLITALDLPELDGFETAPRLCEQIGQAGFDHHLVKPVESAEIESILMAAGRDG